MNNATVGPMSPFFIVKDVIKASHYYRDCLGFDIRFLSPEQDSFFAIVGKESAQLMMKAVSHSVLSQPNHTRHSDALWDAYVFTAQPAAFYELCVSKGATIHKPLQTRDDGLYGFEVSDPDGYVLFFGCPA